MDAGPLSLPATQDLVQGGKEGRRGPRRCSLGRVVELWADPVGRRSSQGTGCLRLGLPHHQQPQTHSCLDPQKRTCSIPPQKQLRGLKSAALQTWGKAAGSDGLCGAWKLHTGFIKMAL